MYLPLWLGLNPARLMKTVRVASAWGPFAHQIFPLGSRPACKMKTASAPFVNRVFAHRNLPVHARVAGPAGVASVWGGFARMKFPLDPRCVGVAEIVRVASAQGVFAHRNLSRSVPLIPKLARTTRSAPAAVVLKGQGPIKLVFAHYRLPWKASAA